MGAVSEEGKAEQLAGQAPAGASQAHPQVGASESQAPAVAGQAHPQVGAGQADVQAGAGLPDYSQPL